MNWTTLNRWAAKLLIHAAGSRCFAGCFAVLTAVVGTLLSEFTTLKIAVEAFVETLLLLPEFVLSVPVVFTIWLLGAWLWCSQSLHRYKARLIQTAMGRLYIDGHIGPKTLQRAISLQRFADDGSDQPCRIDVIEALFPAVPSQPSPLLPDEAIPEAQKGPLDAWFNNARRQPEQPEESSPFQPAISHPAY